jgi:hypothetical protein
MGAPGHFFEDSDWLGRILRGNSLGYLIIFGQSVKRRNMEVLAFLHKRYFSL